MRADQIEGQLCTAQPRVPIIVFLMLAAHTPTTALEPLRLGDLLVVGAGQDYILRYGKQGEFVEAFVSGQPSPKTSVP